MSRERASLDGSGTRRRNRAQAESTADTAAKAKAADVAPSARDTPSAAPPPLVTGDHVISSRTPSRSHEHEGDFSITGVEMPQAVGSPAQPSDEAAPEVADDADFGTVPSLPALPDAPPTLTGMQDSESNLVTGEHARILRRQIAKRRRDTSPDPVALGETHEISRSEVERIRLAAERRQEEESTADRGEFRQAASSVDRLQTNIWERKFNQARRTDPAGRILIGGRYQVDEELADGGMARVFRVQHVDLGKPFALKLIRDNLSENAAARQMFYREAQISSALEHPHIVQVTDFGVDDTLGAYIVMEYLQGVTLRAHLRRTGGLPLQQGLPLVIQIAQALHYMHGQGLIHCDVKSENVFLCRPPEGERQRILVKLIDFGLSKASAQNVRLASSEVAGTPEYIAPEQIRAVAPQPSMDVYSLGILFYEVLTGSTPYSGSPQDLLFAHLNARPVPPSERLPEPLDENVEQFVMRLIAKRPQNRPSSMGQVLYHLRTLSDMLGFGEARRVNARTGKLQTVTHGAPPSHQQAMVSCCPLPMFRVDDNGRLVAANHAFGEFVRAPRRELIGSSLGDTRLSYIYPDVMTVIRDICQNKTSTPVVRVVAFGGHGTTTTVRIVLMPEHDKSSPQHLSGIIHPLEKQPGDS